MEKKQRCIILVKLLVIFNMQVRASHHRLSFTVQGERTVKTGVNHYTTTTSNKSRSMVCSTPLNIWNVSYKITLFKETKNSSFVLGRDERNISHSFENSEEIEGNYTCRLDIKLETRGKIVLLYTIEEKLFVQRRFNARECGTNVGQAGFRWEVVTLTCTRGNIHLNERTMGISVPNIALSSHSLSQYSCVTIKGRNKICNFTSIKIIPFLKIDIIPSSFHSGSRLEFNCTSTPTRFMRWGVRSSNGDILDLDQFKTSLLVATNITIKHDAGKSTLHINEAISGASGISAVFCYTYETKVILAVAHLDPNDCNNRNDFINGGACKHDVGLFTCIAFLIIALLVVMLLICLLVRENMNKAVTQNTVVTTDIVPPETTLHDNPVYGT